METPLFKHGDRVRVAERCFDDHLWGAIGTVLPFPEDITEGPTANGAYWVELDNPLPFPNSPDICPAAEIDGKRLCRI